MKKISVLLLLLSMVCFDAQSKKRVDLLDHFVEKIKSARDVSFDYQVSVLQGTVSISKDAVYLSQKNRMEIYETATTRYLYNLKRKKVDIDHINNNSNNISLLLQWIDKVDEYQQVSREKLEKGSVKYTLQGKKPSNEIIEVTFNSKGVITELSYQSASIKRMTVYIDNFVIDGKPTSSYFTFDPEVRKDLEVTDFRKK